MTVPAERTRAVLQTRKFLQWIQSADLTPEVSVQIKHEARALLRHFPSSVDMELAHLACPMWFGASLDRKGTMAPDEIKRLDADLGFAEPNAQEGIPRKSGLTPFQRFSGLQLFDVRAWAKRKGVKVPKR